MFSSTKTPTNHPVQILGKSPGRLQTWFTTTHPGFIIGPKGSNLLYISDLVNQSYPPHLGINCYLTYEKQPNMINDCA